MPIYEYDCRSCHRRVSLLLRIADLEQSQTCPYCGESEMVRILSRFSVHKSISTIYEESGEPGMSQSADYYKDPRNIGRGVEKRFKNMNIEMPSSIQQSINEAREGKLPDSLKDLNSAASDTTYH
ncbi:MAG: zinc ribbon domain-containing protein [Dehalococcoidia bacterium]|nr:zinc ribbon domain-containing protein [Dehalococcoidia bacterium]